MSDQQLLPSAPPPESSHDLDRTANVVAMASTLAGLFLSVIPCLGDWPYIALWFGVLLSVALVLNGRRVGRRNVYAVVALGLGLAGLWEDERLTPEEEQGLSLAERNNVLTGPRARYGLSHVNPNWLVDLVLTATGYGRPAADTRLVDLGWVEQVHLCNWVAEDIELGLPEPGEVTQCSSGLAFEWSDPMPSLRCDYAVMEPGCGATVAEAGQCFPEFLEVLAADPCIAQSRVTRKRIQKYIAAIPGCRPMKDCIGGMIVGSYFDNIIVDTLFDALAPD